MIRKSLSQDKITAHIDEMSFIEILNIHSTFIIHIMHGYEHMALGTDNIMAIQIYYSIIRLCTCFKDWDRASWLKLVTILANDRQTLRKINIRSFMGINWFMNSVTSSSYIPLIDIDTVINYMKYEWKLSVSAQHS